MGTNKEPTIHTWQCSSQAILFQYLPQYCLFQNLLFQAASSGCRFSLHIENGVEPLCKNWKVLKNLCWTFVQKLNLCTTITNPVAARTCVELAKWWVGQIEVQIWVGKSKHLTLCIKVVSIGCLTAFMTFEYQWSLFRVNLPFMLTSSFRFVLCKKVPLFSFEVLWSDMYLKYKVCRNYLSITSVNL